MTLHQGDCREVLQALPDGSVDAVVTDPPYELGFMGKGWDRSGIAYDVSVWQEALRVLKPGGHVLAFGGSRTYHRLACAIEDAGFEIRDQLQWLYGSGFPKSLDVSKALDKAAGAEREVIGPSARHAGTTTARGSVPDYARFASPDVLTAPATDLARQWDGWGTALKPAHEPIVLARKPLIGTVAANVTQHGTGALNINGCLIGETKDVPASVSRHRSELVWGTYQHETGQEAGHNPNIGRWPANVLLDEEAGALLDAQSGERKSGGGDKHSKTQDGNIFKGLNPVSGLREYQGDTGGASRFFYCAKASRGERNAGLEGMPETARNGEDYRRHVNTSKQSDGGIRGDIPRANHHPTVKPINVMRWLCRLITPPGGLVLDPFMGSGSTGCAAALEGFTFTGIDLDPEYVEIAEARIRYWSMQGAQLTLQVAP